jgi:hypothetical protein
MTERDGPIMPKAFHALFGRIGGYAATREEGMAAFAKSWRRE